MDVREHLRSQKSLESIGALICPVATMLFTFDWMSEGRKAKAKKRSIDIWAVPKYRIKSMPWGNFISMRILYFRFYFRNDSHAKSTFNSVPLTSYTNRCNSISIEMLALVRNRLWCESEYNSIANVQNSIMISFQCVRAKWGRMVITSCVRSAFR